jgi:TrwC relaxase
VSRSTCAFSRVRAALGASGDFPPRPRGSLRSLRPVWSLTEKQLRARRQPKARLITIERIDPFTDERSIETKRLAPVARFDLVFSPPKSVSLLHALGGEETRRAVNEVHLSAWQAALAYLADEACVTRRGAAPRV